MGRLHQVDAKSTVGGGCALIELRVVVALLVALMAILVRSMGRSIERARRAVCLSTQRRAVTGCLTYASDYHGMLPPGGFDTNGDGYVTIGAEPYAATFDYRAPSAGGPIGVGLLANGYVSPGTFPGWVHCPSLDTTNANYTAQGIWSNTPYHSMDVNIPNWWGGVGASYWDDPAYNSQRVIGAYNYRALSWMNTNGQYLRVSSTNSGAPRMLMHTDILDTRCGINHTHR
ncbi:MAG: type II secretion system protein, partial [Proteobacteria bacterium]|nr:type II secretion system protein [Pseudomonadota bacterium]